MSILLNFARHVVVHDGANAFLNSDRNSEIGILIGICGSSLISLIKEEARLLFLKLLPPPPLLISKISFNLLVYSNFSLFWIFK